MDDRSERFRQETRTQLRTLSNGLIGLEADGDPEPEAVDELFRSAHSLKSDLRMAGLDQASDVAHAIEDALEAVRTGSLQPNTQIVDELLAAITEIETILDAADAGESPPEPTATIDDLRSAIAAERADSSSPEAPATDATAEGSTALPEVDVSGPSDISAEEALERASGFDDLDALADEIDADGEFDDLEGWGTFDDAPDERQAPDTSELDSDANEHSDQGDAFGDDGHATGDDSTARETPAGSTFEAIKAEVESVDSDGDIEALEADIEAAEFGEFDDDDELSITDLLEADPAGAVTSEADDAGAERITTEQGTQDEPDEDASFEEIAADVEPDDDLEALEADVEAEQFGEFDEEFTIPELVDADRTELDEEAAFEESDATAGADESEGVESEPPTEIDRDGETAQAGGTGGIDDSGGDPFVTKTPVAADDDPESVHADTATAGDATEPTAAHENEREESGDGLGPDDPEEVDPEIDELLSNVVAEQESTDPAGESAADQSSAMPPDMQSEDAWQTDPAALDLDGFSETDRHTVLESTGQETDAPTAFSRDADVEAFADQFEELFDDVSEPDRPAGPAATTLQESSLAVDSDEEASATPMDSVGGLGSITVGVDVADALLQSIEELATGHLQLERALHDESAGPPPEEVLAELQTVTADLRNTVMDLRLTPLSSVTDDLPRVVRTAARETDTEAELVVDGADVTLDRGVIDRLADPLAHLVRNAVAHGIESPARREASGKPPTGTVEVRAEQRRDRVVIEVSDDGRGLDPDQLRQTAVESGVVEQSEAMKMSDEEAVELAFQAGVSTAEELTEVSGRGVGMDVVEQTITELNGTVDIDSTEGEGTTVRLDLPVSIAVAEVLFVRSGTERYAIPLSEIERVGWPAEISTVNGREMVVLSSPSEEISTTLLDGDTELAFDATDGSIEDRSDEAQRDEAAEPDADDPDPDRYPLIRLAEAFDTAETKDDDGVVVQLRSEVRRLAISCDEIQGMSEVVIDPYTGPLADVPGISGATTLGDGNPVNVIDVHSL